MGEFERGGKPATCSNRHTPSVNWSAVERHFRDTPPAAPRSIQGAFVWPRNAWLAKLHLSRVRRGGSGRRSPSGSPPTGRRSPSTTARAAAPPRRSWRTITKAGGTAVAVRADIGNPATIPGLFADVTKAFGRLDILVNNAAIMKRGFLPDVTAEDIDQHLGLNVRGYLLCAKQAAEMLPKGGCIINITSAISRMAYPGRSCTR